MDGNAAYRLLIHKRKEVKERTSWMQHVRRQGDGGTPNLIIAQRPRAKRNLESLVTRWHTAVAGNKV
jgi:hypothetical protein